MGILAKRIQNKKLSADHNKKNIQEILNKILAISTPDKIFLFGSSNIESNSELSDYDIAIIFKDPLILKKQKKEILIKNLFKNIEVDILFYTEKIFEQKSKIGGVAFEIKQNGKIIYDKKSEI